VERDRREGPADVRGRSPSLLGHLSNRLEGSRVALAEQEPLVCIVDEAQWLDQASWQIAA
jgi:hypothetical protein